MTTALITTCFCNNAAPNCPACHGLNELTFMPIVKGKPMPQQSMSKGKAILVMTEELPANRCRCGSSVRLVLHKDRHSWKVICSQGHEGEASKLPSDAIALWSMELKRK